MDLITLPVAVLSPWPARPTFTTADLFAGPQALSTIRTLAAGSIYALHNIGDVDLFVRELVGLPNTADGGTIIEPGVVSFLQSDPTMPAWVWGAGARIEVSLAPWWLACFRLRGAVGGRARFFSVANPPDTYRIGFLDSLGKVASTRVERDAPSAPQAMRDEATIRYAGYLMHSSFGSISVDDVGPFKVEHVTNHATAWRNCGAGALLAPWKIRRGGVIG